MPLTLSVVQIRLLRAVLPCRRRAPVAAVSARGSCERDSPAGALGLAAAVPACESAGVTSAEADLTEYSPLKSTSMLLRLALGS